MQVINVPSSSFNSQVQEIIRNIQNLEITEEVKSKLITTIQENIPLNRFIDDQTELIDQIQEIDSNYLSSSTRKMRQLISREKFSNSNTSDDFLTEIKIENGDSNVFIPQCSGDIIDNLLNRVSRLEERLYNEKD